MLTLLIVLIKLCSNGNYGMVGTRFLELTNVVFLPSLNILYLCNVCKNDKFHLNVCLVSKKTKFIGFEMVYIVTFIICFYDHSPYLH